MKVKLTGISLFIFWEEYPDGTPDTSPFSSYHTTILCTGYTSDEVVFAPTENRYQIIHPITQGGRIPMCNTNITRYAS